jgi:hypothetical protein
MITTALCRIELKKDFIQDRIDFEMRIVEGGIEDDPDQI